MNTKHMTSLLALAIAAALPFAASAAQPNLSVRDVAATPAQSQSDSIHRIIVNYREGSLARSNPAVATAAINRALSRSGVSASAFGGGGVSHLRKLGTGHDLFKLPASVDRATANTILEQIAANRDVVSVEVDEILRRTASPVVRPAAAPNDPLYTGWQWHFHKPDGNTDSNSTLPNRGGANVADAWDLADGKDIVVAVLDTGITQHPDMDTSLGDAGYDFIFDGWISGRGQDGRAAGGWDLGDWTWLYPNPPAWCTSIFDDSSWHGTHVSATVGAELTNNEAGMAGVAPAAKVLPVRVLGHCGGNLSDIADAIVWASGGSVAGVPANDNPAQIINMSLGGGGACTVNSTMGAAIADAMSRGTVVVVAAGNANSDAANYQPASCPGAIAVASTGITSARASYSNFGQRVDISAPGGGGGADGNPGGYVWQAWNFGLTTPIPLEDLDVDGDYIGMAGTSMASPHVAGIVALMQSARLEAGLDLLTRDEVLAYLQETVTPFAITPPSAQPIGPGIVNAAAAVERALCVGDDCAPEAPPLPPATPIQNRTPVPGLSGDATPQTFMLTVEAGARGPLSIITSGGSGDLTLYVNKDDAPDEVADWTYRSARRGNSETVRINNLQPGEYFIRLVGAPRAYSGVTLRAIHN